MSIHICLKDNKIYFFQYKLLQFIPYQKSNIPYHNQNNIVDIITGVLDKYTDANTNAIQVEVIYYFYFYVLYNCGAGLGV